MTLELILSLAMSAPGASADASGAVYDADSLATTMDEVVVTATRTPKALKDVPVVTRVIGRKEIEHSDATDIKDLLTEEIPGLEFGNAMTQETTLNLSGFGGSSVLFLVDGERLAGETMDNVDYRRLTLGNIERVEIVKGASSALYGANALGGVVNLITRNNTDPLRVDVNTRFREEGKEWRSGANVGFMRGKWNSGTNVEYSRVDRIQLAKPSDAESRIHEIYGGHSLNVSEKLTYSPSGKVRLIARGSYFARTSDRLTYEDHYADYSGGLRMMAHLSKSQLLEVAYSYDQYDKSRYMGGHRTHDHDYSNRQNIVHALYTYFLANGAAVTAGADYMNDYLMSYQFAGNASHSQNSADVFAQYDHNPWSWLNVVGGIRYDYFSASSHSAVTARLALMFKLPWMSVRVSYAGGFRAPTLKELYMDFDMAGLQMLYGNPDLKPEKSHNFNVALERNGNAGGDFFAGSYSLTLSGYHNFYHNRITIAEFVPDFDSAEEDAAQYYNEKRVNVTGIDFSARYRLRNGAGASVSYSYLDTKGNTIDSQFSQPRPHSATWRVYYDHRFSGNYSLYAAVSGRYLSKPDTDLPSDGAYSLWKFTLQQKVWKGFTVDFAIDNLFNYRPAVYYWNSALTTGTTWSLGLRYEF